MPTYVYECADCTKVIEVEQRITDDPLRDCECGSKGTLRRLIQPTAVMFKGSGFYVNDASPAAKPDKTEGCTGTPSACPACAPADSSEA